MELFWWIPALIPTMAVIILLVHPVWPIARWENRNVSTWEAETNRKRFAIYAGVNLAFSLMMAWICYTCALSAQNFNEVWNFRYTKIRCEDRWTEKVQRSKQVYAGEDSKGNSKYHTVYYDVTETYGPYYHRISESGNTERISETTYQSWKKTWGNEKTVGVHKGSSAGSDRAISGDIHEVYWPKTFETVYPGTAIHSYVNKIRVSDSVLQFGRPTKELLQAYPRPVDRGNVSPVVDYAGMGLSTKAFEHLCRVNATLGASKEIHPLLVIVSNRADRAVVNDILRAWGGPNKNELVTFIPATGMNAVPSWVEVHSWMDNTTLHATLRDALMSTNFSFFTYGNLLRQHVPKLWSRKNFGILNDYLKPRIHPGWFIMAALLSIIVCFVSFVVIDRNS